MIEIDNIIVSDEVVEKQFVCDLNKCRGDCCVEGDAGAPLTEEEAEILKSIYPKIKSYLMPQAISEIEKNGTSVIDNEFDIVTPTIQGGICAYGYYDKNNIVKCGIEKAYNDGIIDFKKPISCHLFPIKTNNTNGFEFVNFEPRPKLCKPGCQLGEKLKIPVYKFLKEPLIRKYGNEFYEILVKIERAYYND